MWYWREICASGWKYVVVEGRLWQWRETCGIGGKYVLVEENMWQWMEICDSGRKYVVVDGNMWQWREICGGGRKYVVVDGNMWYWREICGNRRKYVVMEGNMWQWREIRIHSYCRFQNPLGTIYLRVKYNWNPLNKRMMSCIASVEAIDCIKTLICSQQHQVFLSYRPWLSHSTD